MECGASLFGHSWARMRLSSSCWAAVVFLTICSLTASVVTRYSVMGSEVPKVRVVKADSANGKTQHLLPIGLEWSPPSSSLTLFQPLRSSVLAVSEGFQSIELRSDFWLYNRPPPNR